MTKPQRGKTPKKPQRGNKPTDPVNVYCRVRPLEAGRESCSKVISTTTLLLTAPENSHAMKNGLARETQYMFEYVFDEYTTQKALYDHCALPLVEDVIKGRNALLFAYGVTSSGKTHTMAGTPQDQGVLPRCLDVLFNSIGELQSRKYVFKPDKMNSFDIQTEADAMLERQRREITPKLIQSAPHAPGTPRPRGGGDFFDAKQPRMRDLSVIGDIEEDNNYAVFVSYVEIYNNYIYDLLEELPYNPITGHHNQPKPLAPKSEAGPYSGTPHSKILREDCNHNMYVSGVVEIEVKSTEEAYEVLSKGQKRRKVAHTALNTESSRSHSVFNIRLVQGPLDPRGEELLQDKSKVVISQLALVDLAGSERLARTQSKNGDRVREAGNINQSLMTLRSCIEALRENQKTGASRMVPYRDSRLTHLFKNYFDGEGKVRMIVCVNPIAEDYDETVQVMRFAEMTQEVQVARPQQVRFDIGLTPGRRRLNQQFKENIAKVYEEGGNPEEVEIPSTMVYSMGPSFPSLRLVDPSDDVTLPILEQFLKDRQHRRTTLLTDLTNKHEHFRRNLMETETENQSLKRKIDELEVELKSRDAEFNRQSKRLRSLEKNNDMLQRTTTMYEQEQRKMEREIDERDWKIQQEKSAKDRLQQDYKAKITLSEHNFHKQIEREKRKLKDEAEAQIRAKQKKLQMVKNIVNLYEEDNASVSSGSSVSSPASRHTRAATTSRILAAKSEPNLAGDMKNTPRPTVAPKPAHARAKTTHTSMATRYGSPMTARSRSPPPPTKPKPAYNPRLHRRSKSSHEIWLEHKPANIIEGGTLLQPKMKKRRSVTKLSEKDTKTASKYVLTHQELDSDGDLATKYVKGDIIPSAGGGASVVFHDVETLKQKEPADKYSHGYQARPEDYDGDWTDTEDRCKLAYEHHGQLQARLRTSQV